MFHTQLCDLLGMKYPIIQGAMGCVGDPRLTIVMYSISDGNGRRSAFRAGKMSLTGFGEVHIRLGSLAAPPI